MNSTEKLKDFFSEPACQSFYISVLLNGFDVKVARTGKMVCTRVERVAHNRVQLISGLVRIHRKFMVNIHVDDKFIEMMPIEDFSVIELFKSKKVLK